ncbi:MAG: dihydroneopterin aldolase [Betaproteobacteria bacterium]|nr:MAG: dihydroneopterin aldolase [Betaproteobacteria bacterium]
MDIIFLREVRLDARIGIYRREKSITQTVELDLDIALPDERVFKSGKIADTIDYAVVVERIRAALVERHYGLVENLAEHVAQIILDEFHAPWVRVGIAKIGAQPSARRVGVVIERGREK